MITALHQEDPEKKKEMMGDLMGNYFPNYFAKIDKRLETNGQPGHLVADRMTIADILLGSFLS